MCGYFCAVSPETLTKGLSDKPPLTCHESTMKIKIRFMPTRKESKTIEIKKGATADDAIRALGLFPDAWIPVKGNTPIPLDDVLEDGDELKLIAVVSGG
jgi:sulfur carrier protein ThiS